MGGTMTQEKVSIQDRYLNELRKSRRPARVMLSNGKEIRGVVTGFDPFTFTLRSMDTEVLIYKSAVAIIAPEGRLSAVSDEAGDDSDTVQ